MHDSNILEVVGAIAHLADEINKTDWVFCGIYRGAAEGWIGDAVWIRVKRGTDHYRIPISPGLLLEDFCGRVVIERLENHQQEAPAALTGA